MWFALSVLACKKIGFDLDVDLQPPDAPPVAEVVAQPWELSLYDERSGGVLPAFLDTATTGPLLVADRIRAAEGDGFFTVEVRDASLVAEAPLTLVFEVLAQGGRRHALGDETHEPLGDACTLTVEPGFDPADHAADLLACLRAYTVAEGGPVDFSLTVAGTTEDDDWEYHATYVFGTDRPVEASCTGTYVLADELKEQAGTVDLRLDDLTLAGYAAAADESMAVVVFAGTWEDGAELPVAGASATTRVDAGKGRFFAREIEVAEDVPERIAFGGTDPVTTWPTDYKQVAIDTLLADGTVDTCEVRVHDALPNDAWTSVALVGSGIAARE